MFTINITPTDAGNRADHKIADVELHFTAAAGALARLKLIGFTVGELPGQSRYVTYPACHVESVDGVPCTVHLLRPIDDDGTLDRIGERILDAYGKFEQRNSEAL